MKFKLFTPPHFLGIFFVLLLYSIGSCEKDMYQNAIYTTSKDKINYVTIDAVPFLVPSIQKFNKNYYYLSRTSKSSANLNIEDLNLNLDEILEYVKENGKKSYSIKIINKLDSDKYTENLHVAEFNGSFETFILRWVPDNSNVELSLNSFTGKVMCFDIDYNLKNTKTFISGKITSNTTGKNNSTAKSNTAEPTCTYDIQSCWCKDELIGDGHTCTTAIYVFCSGGGGGVTGFGSSGTSESGTAASGGQTGTGETISSETSTNDSVINVAPNFDTYQQNFVNSLGKSKGSFYELHPETQKIIFKYLSFTEYEDPNKTRVKNALINIDIDWLKQQSSINEIIIADFLFNNEFSTESQSIMTQLKDQIIQNPNLNIDIEASLNSPFNIDKTTITDATTEGEKFNEVYDALLSSPEFKALFIDLFDDNNRFNVKFVIGDITSGANGNTNTDLSNPTLNLITISPTFLKNANKMEIAKTILHECIHAYLNVKLCDGGQGISISNLNNLDLYNLINEKYNGFIGNQEQHNFIYNFMLPTMVKVLTEVKGKLVSTADDINISETILFPNHPATKPMVAFNWNECLNNLALSGLQSCSFFQNEIGTFFPNGEPNITVNSVKMNNYNQYNKIVRTWLK